MANVTRSLCCNVHCIPTKQHLKQLYSTIRVDDSKRILGAIIITIIIGPTIPPKQRKASYLTSAMKEETRQPARVCYRRTTGVETLPYTSMQ